MYANICKTRHWPQLTRHKSSKYPNFQVLTIFCFATCQKHSTFFLINMQMWGIRFVCWIELIPATSSACAVITNYRQASDGRLKLWILSDGLLPLGRNPNQHNWSDTQIRRQHSNLAHPLSVSKGYYFSLFSFPYHVIVVAATLGPRCGQLPDMLISRQFVHI